MSQASRQVGPVLESHFRFLLWLVPALNRFPRDQKFLLGDRIQTLGQNILEALIEANYTRDRRGHLLRANMGLEKLRYFIRLAVEMHYLDRPRNLRSANRNRNQPDNRNNNVGFRVASTLIPPEPEGSWSFREST